MQICKDADLNFFFQLKTYLYFFLRYRSDFSLIHADLKYRKRLNMIVFVFVFVFFNSCWINLDYEWNSLLKKIFFIFFKTYKNKFDFSIVKNHFFLSSQYRSGFLPSKTTFSTYYKIDLVFWQIIFFFFLSIKTNLNFF